jgi:hypothetical protein
VVRGALTAVAIHQAVMGENLFLYFAAIYPESLRISEVALGAAHHVVYSEVNAA